MSCRISLDPILGFPGRLKHLPWICRWWRCATMEMRLFVRRWERGVEWISSFDGIQNVSAHFSFIWIQIRE
ncbi:hypothetical protein HanIR_Chr13g0653671 [Helianthus annuus]|nr:hypothetical protein HanIR_Chr13g0653671 [Helianthus annuus]